MNFAYCCCVVLLLDWMCYSFSDLHLHLSSSLYIVRDSNVSVVRERNFLRTSNGVHCFLAGTKVTACTNLFSHMYCCQSLVLSPFTSEQFELQSKLDQNQSLA